VSKLFTSEMTQPILSFSVLEGLPKNRNPRNPQNVRNPCLKIEIQEIHSNATLAKYRNPRNPLTVRNPPA